MKLLRTEKYEAQLDGGRAYIYFDDFSDVLYIDDIEYADNPEELIDAELELLSRSSRAHASALL